MKVMKIRKGRVIEIYGLMLWCKKKMKEWLCKNLWWIKNEKKKNEMLKKINK
jgi:hypothetical protein